MHGNRMSNTLSYIKDNFRFLLAIMANILALVASIWWLIDSNWKTGKTLEIERVVSSIALTATLLGLNFVNNKLSKPLLKVKLSISFSHNNLYGTKQGMNITIENHSIIKTFISQFQLELPSKKAVIPLLYEGFTSAPLPKVILEPGQSFSFNVISENLNGAPSDLSEYGRFIVKTDIGHKFYVPAVELRKQLGYLFKSKA